MNRLAIDWQQGWELMGWTMCYFLVAGTLVALAGAMIRFACLHMAPSVRYSVSLAVFAMLALSPIGIALWLAQSTLPEFATTALPSTPKFIELAISPETTSSEPKASATVPTATDAVPDQDSVAWIVAYLPWIWVVGTPMTLALLTTGLIGSERLRRDCESMVTGRIADACHQLRTSLGIGRRVSVAVCERIASPLLIGIVRPLILLPPAALTGWSPEQLEMVLLHELAHVRRWDNLVNLVQRLVESLLFFHPAVWLVSRQVRRDREECCDAVVVAHTAKPQAYAELLVSLATPAHPLAGLAMAQHPLAQRIRRILKLEDETMLVSRSTMGIVVLSLVAMLTVAVWQPSARSVTEENAIAEVASEKETASPYLYDGKTFEEWRSQWKNELSIKHRTETVWAMAAFGNTGRGKESSEVILEIAGQYDWKRLEQGLIGQLQFACINAFGTKSIFGDRSLGAGPPNALPRKEAKEALSTAMQSENVRVRAFVEYVLPNFESLLEIYQQQWEKDEELRKYWGPKRTVAPGIGGGGGGGISTLPQ